MLVMILVASSDAKMADESYHVVIKLILVTMLRIKVIRSRVFQPGD